MKSEKAHARMIHNEAVFREYNEKVQRGIRQLEQMAEETTHKISNDFTDHKLHFYCECSDEDCTKRVVMTTKQYEDIHVNRKAFVVLKGHETASIERTISSTNSYCIVEKYKQPETTGVDLTKPLPTTS